MPKGALGAIDVDANGGLGRVSQVKDRVCFVNAYPEVRPLLNAILLNVINTEEAMADRFSWPILQSKYTQVQSELIDTLRFLVSDCLERSVHELGDLRFDSRGAPFFVSLS